LKFNSLLENLSHGETTSEAVKKVRSLRPSEQIFHLNDPVGSLISKEFKECVHTIGEIAISVRKI